MDKEFIVDLQYKFIDSTKVHQFRDLGGIEDELIGYLASSAGIHPDDNEAISFLVFKVAGIDMDGDVTELTVNGKEIVLPKDVSCWFLKSERELFVDVSNSETFKAHRAILQKRVDELTGMIAELDAKIKAEEQG